MNRIDAWIAEGAGARAVGWWRARAPRERWMLAAMCAAIAAFVLWFAVFAPLRAARDRAQARHAAAAAACAEVERALAGAEAAAAARPAPPADAYGDLLADSAGAAGVGLDRRDPLPDGGIGIGIEATTAATLFAWLDALRLEHGIAPVEVELERREGRLRAALRFPPP